MSAITTHVLDIALGMPAAGIRVFLELRVEDRWRIVAESVTDRDGRCRDLAPDPENGTYRLTFKTGEYLKGQGRTTLYPEVSVVFERRSDAHYHLPLLLSDNGYTTYRGS